MSATPIWIIVVAGVIGVSVLIAIAAGIAVLVASGRDKREG
jgi:hypothetical protein